MHQLARSTWKRTASQLQEEQALKPDRTIEQRLTEEGVTLVPPAEDTEQVKVLRLRRDQIDPIHLLPDTASSATAMETCSCCYKCKPGQQTGICTHSWCW